MGNCLYSVGTFGIFFELLDMRKRAVPLFKERHFTMIIQNGKFEKPVWQGENDNKKLGDKRDVKTLRTPSGQEYQIDMSYREWALLFLLVQEYKRCS